MLREDTEVRLVVVDMADKEAYARGLVRRVYEELMVPAFGRFPDELESLESWTERLEEAPPELSSSSSSSILFHLLVVLRVPPPPTASPLLPSSWPTDKPAEGWREVSSDAVRPWWGGHRHRHGDHPDHARQDVHDDDDDDGAVVAGLEVVGATACEYYPRSNCGLLTCVSPPPSHLLDYIRLWVGIHSSRDVVGGLVGVVQLHRHPRALAA